MWVVAALGNTAMLALLLANGANVNAADEVIHTLSTNTHEFDGHILSHSILTLT